MHDSKIATIVMCVCVSLQFIFPSSARADGVSPVDRPRGNVSLFRTNHSHHHPNHHNHHLRLARRITNIMRRRKGRREKEKEKDKEKEGEEEEEGEGDRGYFLPKLRHRFAARARGHLEKPRMQGKGHLPKYMLDLYETVKEIEESTSHTEMNIPWKKNIFQKDNIRPLIEGILPIHQYHIKSIWEYRFNWSKLPEKVCESELVLILEPHHHSHCHFTDLRLHTTPSHFSLPKMHFKENNLVMNVTDAVKRAKKMKTDTLTLRLISPHQHRDPCLSKAHVLLVMYTGVRIESIRNASTHRKHQLSRTLVGRHRRSVDETNTTTSLEEIPFQRDNITGKNLTVCHIKPWHINFKDLQWNWIHYPTNYSISYCSGICVGLMDSRISNHAFLRSKYHMATQYRNRNIPFPCCVPSLLSSLTMLYTDRNENTVIGNLPNIVVRKCSCW